MARILITIDAAPNSPRCPSKCRMRDPYMLHPPGCRAFRQRGHSAPLPADSRGYLRCQQCLDAERWAESGGSCAVG